MSPERARVRFAPSPTGQLHIGGARTALFNWLFAKRHGGTFILRIEDTDEARSTPETTRGIFESLRWLGLDWDEGPSGPESLAGAGPFGPYHQMAPECRERYTRHAGRLLEDRRAYKCFCTPEEVARMRELAQSEGRTPGYDGRCARLSDDEVASRERGGAPFSVRLKIDRRGAVVVDDMIRGAVSFDNALLQDLVLLKSSGGPTYNFACVVDDHHMEITHVIRGDDHLTNTASQIQLYAAFGWTPPRFAHLSMIHGPDGKKLSKRHGAASVGEYRDLGYLPEALRNYLALLGWSTPDSRQLFAGEELISSFDISGCQKNPARFDCEKLTWMNGEHLRKLPAGELIQAAGSFLKAAGLDGVPRERLVPALELEREKYHLLTDVPVRLEVFFKDVAYEAKAVEKVLKKDGVGEVLDGLGEILAVVEPFAEGELERRIRAFCTDRGLGTGKVFHPLRVAVSGRTEGPTLFGMLALLGKETVLKRIGDARRMLQPA